MKPLASGRVGQDAQLLLQPCARPPIDEAGEELPDDAAAIEAARQAAREMLLAVHREIRGLTILARDLALWLAATLVAAAVAIPLAKILDFML
jgi:hypothetical protein